MEDVRTVLMYTDAVLVVVVVTVTADMGLAVDDKGLLAVFFGKDVGYDRTGNTGTYNDIFHLISLQ